MPVTAIKSVAFALGALLLAISWDLLRTSGTLSDPDIDLVIRQNAARDTCVPQKPCVVDFHRLLSHPDTFDETYVRLSGVMRLEFEGNSLYSSTEAYETRETNSAVWLTGSLVNRHHASSDATAVSLIGLFRGRRNMDQRRCYGHACAWPAEVEVIEFIDNES